MIPIRWTHIGDGELRCEIKKQAECLCNNPKVKYRFLGQKNRKEIYDYYKDQRVDLFVNCSDSEGIPVSIMEALSFGIPVVTRNVGGNSEIVDGSCGILLDEAVSSSDLSDAICKMYELEEGEYSNLRKGAYVMFRNRYDAKKNYAEFFDELSGGYILELAWGCPSKRYPLNGIFQFDQASALKNEGESVVYAAIDMRSIKNWRKFGINHRIWKDIDVYEFNMPFGPFLVPIRHLLEKICFILLINRIIRKFGKPKCVHVHNCDVCLCSMGYCLKHGIQYIITEHSMPRAQSKRVEKSKRWAYKNAKKVIAVSANLAGRIHCIYNVQPIIIHNIVDFSQFSFILNENRNDDDTFLFISAARLVAGKRIDLLLEAFARVVKKYNNCRLEIMGEGPERNNLQNQAEKLDISEKVSFYGYYSKAEFAVELRKSACFVLPSRSETFGIVYVEALACGNPVIATRCGGPEDFVDKTNGVLVELDDVAALESAMVYMLKNIKLYDREYIATECKNRFSPNIIARKIISIVNG